MKEELYFSLVNICEKVAIDTHMWIGSGNKEEIDRAAVEAFRYGLNQLDDSFRIVCGEGEIDEAPMLYEGECFGKERSSHSYDIAVDPIEGTTLTAKGLPGAVTVMAMAKKGKMINTPDMYMEKLMVGPKARGSIDLRISIDENIVSVAEKLKKDIQDVTVMILDKPRHAQVIHSLRTKGMKVVTPSDGDVIGSLLLALNKGEIDLIYGIGGSPEGVLSAVALKALGGEMQARLLLRSDVKGKSSENDAISLQEVARCKKKGIPVKEILTIDDLIYDNEAIFIATGITNSDVLEGITLKKNTTKRTQSLLIIGKERKVQYITTEYLEKDLIDSLPTI